MYIDKATITIESGRGGNGAISFRREKFVPKGGPDGGDGGKGGDVILRATTSELTLIALKFQPNWKAQNGENGAYRQRTGAHGEDVVISVPVGTLVFDTETNELIADLDTEGKTFVAAKGGRGGRGNMHYATPTRQAPRIATPGTPGERKVLDLELKTVADVGLVGYPNAGKSTLLRALSNARPKVAAYPFTTLHPHVGVVELDNFKTFTIADIPGLIDGASDNVGLGHDFLRHIERCRLICFVLDMGGVDGRDPLDDLASLRDELEKYDPDLAKRPYIIVANKMDLEKAEENWPRLQEAEPNSILFQTIAELGEEADALKKLLARALSLLPPEPPEIRRKILAKHRVPQRPEPQLDDDDDMI